MLGTERRVSASTHNQALLARLLYGTGMRLMEGLRLRIKDVDFDRHAVIVRQAKVNKDRVVIASTSAAGSRCRMFWPSNTPGSVKAGRGVQALPINLYTI